MRKGKELKEIIQNHVTPLMNTFEEKTEKSGGSVAPLFDPVDWLFGLLVRKTLEKIKGFLKGDRGMSFGGVKWHLDGTTQFGTISIYYGGEWHAIMTFPAGASASDILKTSSSIIDELVRENKISRDQASRLKMFLLIAVVEMINEGVVTDDLDARHHIRKIEEFTDSFILDENFGGLIVD